MTFNINYNYNYNYKEERLYNDVAAKKRAESINRNVVDQNAIYQNAIYQNEIGHNAIDQKELNIFECTRSVEKNAIDLKFNRSIVKK